MASRRSPGRGTSCWATSARALLELLSGRLVAGTTAVVVTARRPLGLGAELRLAALSEDELA